MTFYVTKTFKTNLFHELLGHLPTLVYAKRHCNENPKCLFFLAGNPSRVTRLNNSLYQYNMTSAFQGPLLRDVCDTDLSVTAQRDLLIQRAVQREGEPKLLPGFEVFLLTASSYQKY